MTPTPRPRGWSDDHRRVLTDDEWAASYDLMADGYQNRGQSGLATVCRRRASRILQDGPDRFTGSEVAQVLKAASWSPPAGLSGFHEFGRRA